MSAKLTPDLAQALSRLVAADLDQRKAACGGDRFHRAANRFDEAASKVAREARLAGYGGEGH